MSDEYKKDPQYQKGYFQGKSMSDVYPDMLAKLNKLDERDPYVYGMKDGYNDYIEEQRRKQEQQKHEKNPEYLKGYIQGKNVADVYPELAGQLEKLPESDPYTLGLKKGSKEFIDAQKERGNVTTTLGRNWEKANLQEPFNERTEKSDKQPPKSKFYDFDKD